MKTEVLSPSSFIAPLRPPPSLMIPTRLPASLRSWKRRRLKVVRKTTSASIEGLFHGIVSVFPSVNSLDLIVPALGFALGAALYFSTDKRRRWSDGDSAAAGDWVLFSSSTPFNRSVVLRCPTISFEDGGGLLDGVNERLMEEDRHFVVLNSGRIPLNRVDKLVEEEIAYQRTCVRTEDGGVIALDWPENLDLEKEFGLDTTVLLVPGTTEGSWDGDVRAFVCETLRHGCFPVVMNPRGCGGSPVINPRLFSAADSDDIRTTVQFIKQSRPRATLMGVGWGYGSNMLTKYLSEAGDQTSVTAAVCINNPFDLDEATLSDPHSVVLDQRIVHGLVDILQANKEIFQGKGKRFNLERGLKATSICDFDKAISMISYGFESIGEFYLKCSTRRSIGNVKIPTLFVQNNDRMVPPFSALHKSIVKNPFTSLLMCYCLPWNATISEKSAISWRRHLAIEWLQAVELALLKGRHPLLEDVDIPLKPSYDLPLLGTRISGSKIDEKCPSPSQNTEFGKHALKLPQSNSLGRYFKHSLASVIDEGDTSPQGAKGVETSSTMEISIDGALKTDTTLFMEQADDENNQALTTATVVLNMLDLTMPGSLDNDQRRKVLTAVNQGETLIKALQGAVPEDVRGRLTVAVSEIVNTQRSELNLDGLTKLGWSPDFKFDIKSTIQEGFKGTSRVEVNELEHQGKTAANDEVHTNSTEFHFDGSNTTGCTTSQGKITQHSEMSTPGSEMENNSREINMTEVGVVVKEAGYKQDTAIESHNVDLPHVDGQKVSEEADDIHGSGLEKGVSESDDVKQVSSSDSDKISLLDEVKDADRSETDKGGKVDQKRSVKPESSSLLGSPSSINVSEALDAFRSFDDSTQMAVNSVFGVIENMIDQLEKKSDEDLRVENKEMESKTGEEKKDLDSDYKIENRGENFMSGNEGRGQDQIPAFDGPPVNGFTYENKERDLVDSNIPESSKKLDDIFEGYSGTTSPDVKWDEEAKFMPNPVNNASTYHAYRNNVENNEMVKKGNWDLSHNAYLHRYLSSKLSHMRSIDTKKTTDLFLDTEKGQWKISEQLDDDNSSLEETRLNKRINEQGQNPKPWLPMVDRDKVFDASHLVLDNTSSELEKQSKIETETGGDNGMKNGFLNVKEELMKLVRNTILDTLKIEVKRSLGIVDDTDIDPELASDLEEVSVSVSCAILQDNDQTLSFENKDSSSKFGKLEGQRVINTISSAVQSTDHLRNVLPIGVIVGSSLASLHEYFDIADVSNDQQDKDSMNFNMQAKLNGRDSDDKNKEHIDANNFGWDTNLGLVDSHASKMVGAITGVICASAVLAYRQKDNMKETYETMISSPSCDVVDTPKEKDKCEEGLDDTVENNVASSVAQKAMSAAASEVPTKYDGGFDAERMMSILADLGQKGGLLRFFGNVALLWGGIRGAMSLTDRLIRFLHIAECHLFHRIFGFVCMLLVMWSPVAVPLLPKIVQSWTANSSIGIAGYASVAGLHVAMLILIMLWGKRIREYDYPLKQYGLDFSSIVKVHAFLKGLIGGAMLVLSVHLANALLGHAHFVSPPYLPPFSAGVAPFLKAHGKLLLLFTRGFVIASSVSIVEELLFRSWLPNEISVDLGSHLAIVLSGLAFALFQRSLSSIPGFLFLSFALFGAKQRDHGSLYIPIGIRTGIILVSFLIQDIGFVSYERSTPFWLAGANSWHPFNSAVGLISCIILATLLYPKQPLEQGPSTDKEQKGDA